MNHYQILYKLQYGLTFIIKIITLFLIILAFFLSFFFYFFTHYSNQYITIENFKSNKESFLEIKDDIVGNKFLLGERLGKECIGDSLCEYRYRFFNKKMENLNIDYITYYENKSDNYYSITFNLDKKDYFQGLNPILSFNTNGDNKNDGWYLPFPFSNKLFYIGSKYIDIDENWKAYGYFDSAFN